MIVARHRGAHGLLAPHLCQPRAARAAGRPIAEPAARGRVTDAYLPKIEEWIEGSKGRIRTDKAHEKLLALGYEGSLMGTQPAAKSMAVVNHRVLTSSLPRRLANYLP